MKGWVDVAIPAVGGLLLLLLAVNPQWLFKPSGEPEKDARRTRTLRRTGFVLLVVACIYMFIKLANGQALPPEMTMHRIQAGEPDASGWMVAASTKGGFSVRLPLKFNDFTIAESDPKAPQLRLFAVGTKSQEGIKFSATRIVYRNGAESAKYFFSRLEKGQGLSSTPERVTRINVGERQAIDLVLKRTSDVAYQRVVMLQSDLLMMIVESPRSHEVTAQQFATKFFDSLVVSVR